MLVKSICLSAVVTLAVSNWMLSQSADTRLSVPTLATPPPTFTTSPDAPVTPPVPTLKPVRYDDAQRLCLYKTIYGEARSEPHDAQQAVATVIMNRVASPKFPDTICGVVQHQRRKGKYQFDVWNPNEVNLAKMHAAFSDETFDKASLKVMHNGLTVLRGTRALPDDAFNFHTKGHDNRWTDGLTRHAVLGNHVFYRGF